MNITHEKKTYDLKIEYAGGTVTVNYMGLPAAIRGDENIVLKNLSERGGARVFLNGTEAAQDFSYKLLSFIVIRLASDDAFFEAFSDLCRRSGINTDLSIGTPAGEPDADIGIVFRFIPLERLEKTRGPVLEIFVRDSFIKDFLKKNSSFSIQELD